MEKSLEFSTTRKQNTNKTKYRAAALTNPHLCYQPSQEELEVLPTQQVEDRNKRNIHCH